MAIALLAKLRSLHTAAIQYPYIVITLPRIIAISSHAYVSRTICLEPALTYLSLFTHAQELHTECSDMLSVYANCDREAYHQLTSYEGVLMVDRQVCRQTPASSERP